MTRPSVAGPERSATPTVLVDPALDDALARDGYVVVPFLPADEVAHLRSTHERLRPDDDVGLAIDFVRTDRSIVREVHRLLQPMWEDHLPGLFRGYEPVVSTFVVKQPGAGSEMKLHHEPTFAVDGVRTYNIWIPLVDVTAAAGNGALQIIPGTDHLRYGHVGFNTPVLFRPYEAFLGRHLRTLDVTAGHAVIYDTRMLHASLPNGSAQPRPAIAAALAPRGTQLTHTVATGNRSRQVHAVDTGFFLEFHPADVAGRIGDRYPVIEELEEGWTLSPEEVARAVGTEVLPRPEVLVPADLSPAGSVSPGLEVGASPLSVTAAPEPGATVGPGPFGGSGVIVVAATGGAGLRGLVHRWRRQVPADRTPVVDGATVRRPRDAVWVTLPPGARLTFELLWKRGGRLSAVDVAALEAGVQVHPSSWAQLETGSMVELPSGVRVTLWNGGPGGAQVLLWR